MYRIQWRISENYHYAVLDVHAGPGPKSQDVMKAEVKQAIPASTGPLD